jgi:hypothetical protein
VGIALAFLGLPELALAGTVQVGDSTGSTPKPIEGSDLEVSFNPTVLVTTQASDTASTLLAQLAQGINEAGDGVYVAEVTLPTELEIRRTAGGDIDDLRFRENDAGIQSATISLLRPRLAAWIGAVWETPSEGVLIVTLNQDTVVVETSGKGSAAAVALALIEALQAAGFWVDYVPPFIVVRRSLATGESITRLGLRSTDPAIISSDLALLPEITPGSGSSSPGPGPDPGSGPGGSGEKKLKP